MFTERESRIDWGWEFQALAAITGKLRSAMARYDLVTGTTNVDVSMADLRGLDAMHHACKNLGS